MTGRAWSRAWRPLAEAAAALLPRATGGPPSWVAVIEDEAGAFHSGVSLSIEEVPAASLCAEQIAVAALRLRGSGAATRIVVVAQPPRRPAPPCGRCLQILHELAPQAEIRWGSPERESGRARIARLLPDAFGDYRRNETAERRRP